MPPGATLRLTVGTLFVPVSVPRAQEKVDVLVHFHGDLATVAREVTAARLSAVLIDITYPGLSAAYAAPFRDTALFNRILREGIERLRDGGFLKEDGGYGRVCVASFSAGYGAVREILKSPDHFEQIAGLYMADSIYAGYVEDAAGHKVDPAHMADFRRFALAAAAKRKTFVLTHSQLVPGSYASTVETADDLIAAVGASRMPADKPGALRIISECHQGNFHVYGCAGADGQAHMQHLRNLSGWLPLLPLSRTATQPGP